MAKKKKLIVVKGYGSSPYKSYSMGFALVSSPKDGRRQCNDFITCRDQLCNALRSGALGISCSSAHNPDSDPPMDFEKTRLLVARDIRDPDREFKDIRNKLFSGKRAINFYEQMAGWKPSTITTVNHTARSHAWLITGPKQWMTYSNLLSMMCLILRVACAHGPIKFETEDDLVKEWQRLSRNTGDYDCNNWIKRCHPWFSVLMRRHDDIFTPKSLDKTYQKSADSYYSAGGIYSLITGATNNDELTRNIRKIGKEEKLIK